ncbi:MAG: hypothetical protein MAG715_00748 [Methanonatronarchaeales archaeon]|nr:hypothetical protein [Methanonatronarchaeales archaeon]
MGYAAVPVGAAINDSGGDAGLSGEDLRVATLDVEGMVCDGCRLTVKNYLESMDGTGEVTVSLPKKQVTVVYDSTRLSAQDIVESDVFQGAYSATLKDDGSYESAP